jgi:hypothetical protein
VSLKRSCINIFYNQDLNVDKKIYLMPFTTNVSSLPDFRQYIQPDRFLPRGQFVEKMPRILIVFYRNEDKISSSQEVIKKNRIWGEFDQW